MVRRNSKFLSVVASVVGLSLFSAIPAKAAFTVVVSQVGSNVVLTGSGSINTGSLTSPGTATNQLVFIEPGGVSGSSIRTFLALGPAPGTNVPTDTYIVTLNSGPATGFGTGALTIATSGSGDFVDFAESNFSATTFAYPITGNLALPRSYVSGAPLSDSETFTNTTIAALGIATGTETYSFGSGSTADSIVVTTATSVPEPTSLSLLGIGAAALLGRRRRKI